MHLLTQVPRNTFSGGYGFLVEVCHLSSDWKNCTLAPMLQARATRTWIIAISGGKHALTEGQRRYNDAPEPDALFGCNCNTQFMTVSIQQQHYGGTRH